VSERDPTSGLLMPRTGAEWRAVLDAAGLRHVRMPDHIWGLGYEWHKHKRRPWDARTTRQRTQARRKRRGWR
jgi:hypothetical protein